MQVPVRQSIIDLRVHETGVGVEFAANFQSRKISRGCGIEDSN
jgi:hypothetical protein